MSDSSESPEGTEPSVDPHAAVAASAAQTQSILWRAIVPTAIVGGVAVLIGLAVAGAPGAIGAAIGALLTIAFFTVGQWLLAYVLQTNPALAQSAALAIYTGKLLALLLLLLLLKDSAWLDDRVFGFTIVACTIVWLATEVAAVARFRGPSVVPGSGPDVVPEIRDPKGSV